VIFAGITPIIFNGCSGTGGSRRGIGGTNAARASFPDMGPREQDNDMLLLVVASLICVTIAGGFEIGRSPQAAAARPNLAVPTRVASDEPVRVVLPFTPNITPRER
jgi:hypothetical protein